MRCRIDHTAAGQPPMELSGPEGTIEAWDLGAVEAALVAVQAAAEAGLFAAGFVSYEAAPAFDPAFSTHPPSPAKQRDPDLPLVWFGLFSGLRPAADLPERLGAPRPRHDASPRWACDNDADEHAEGIVRVQKEIGAGNAYLVNLTTRFRRRWNPEDDPFELYQQLVSDYSAGYHAYLETDEWAVACASPELFFEWSSGAITTRPMKGTAPRGRWSEEDLRHARALGASAKERAENTMVVDMLRNDVGRIALPGSVTVPSLWQVEQHPAAWQMSSTVQAVTPRDIGLPAVFRAVFPCASVTGAPKVSAMSIIAELEDAPRGVYCGAVGLVRPGDGDDPAPVARFAVAIRTAVVDRSGLHATYGSGGGITWDSTPKDEWEEVLLKARALDHPRPITLEAERGLIETMAFEPGPDGTGRIRYLGDHLDRLGASARYFGWTVPPTVGTQLARATHGSRTPRRVRLVLRTGGQLEIETQPFDDRAPERPLLLCVDRVPVDSAEPLLFHKTTDRGRYDARMLRHPSADDVILVNERREITETTRANLAVLLGTQWYTPPLSCGLLPGIQRARDLRDGRLVERAITLDELAWADAVATLSSLRGWRPAQVHIDCDCHA